MGKKVPNLTGDRQAWHLVVLGFAVTQLLFLIPIIIKAASKPLLAPGDEYRTEMKPVLW
jgi:hypothetical protein